MRSPSLKQSLAFAFDHINPDHLLTENEALRLVGEVPNSVDRTKLISHTVVLHALLKAATTRLAATPEPVVEAPHPWAVRRGDGSLDYFSTRSAARKAANREQGDVVKDLR